MEQIDPLRDRVIEFSFYGNPFTAIFRISDASGWTIFDANGCPLPTESHPDIWTYFRSKVEHDETNQSKHYYIDKEIFIPSMELLELATWFSLNYKHIAPGTYKSSNEKYTISYVQDLNVPTKTLARIGHDSGIIQISKKQARNSSYTDHFIFYLILWCVCRRTDPSEITADRLTLEYYLKTGRPAHDIYEGCRELLVDQSPSELNVKRMKGIIAVLADLLKTESMTKVKKGIFSLVGKIFHRRKPK